MKMVKDKRLFNGTIFGSLWLVFCIATVMASPSRMNSTDFSNNMRKLWEEHISWTRLYIVNTMADLPAKKATADRLLLNQADIGNLVKPFYGDAVGKKLTSLLRDHILIAAEIIDAAKAGDASKREVASKRWYRNSDDIALFLAKANPKNWVSSKMRPMLRDHLDTTTEEVEANLKKDWVADIAAYDKLHGQILEMADMLSSGIIKQFPNKFKK
jgi:hypothetical protein